MHNKPHTEEVKRKISVALTGKHRESSIKIGEGIYRDTGCKLWPKCTDCPIDLDRCPENRESRQSRWGELNPKVAKGLEALRIVAGGDILDEGSPMNLRWKKYWADKGVSV